MMHVQENITVLLKCYPEKQVLMNSKISVCNRFLFL